MKTNVLVVANQTADSPELLEALLERAGRGDVDFMLLVPATPHGVAWATDMHSGKEGAEKRKEEALAHLRQAGLEVEGEVGDPDPIAAVQDIWDPGKFDEVIVSTLPTHVSKWLKVDLPHRVERLTDAPVKHVTAKERKPATTQ
jgi:hypothetical protein